MCGLAARHGAKSRQTWGASARRVANRRADLVGAFRRRRRRGAARRLGGCAVSLRHRQPRRIVAGRHAGGAARSAWPPAPRFPRSSISACSAIPMHRLFRRHIRLDHAVGGRDGGASDSVHPTRRLSGVSHIDDLGHLWLLPQDSIPGRLLHTLIGYSDAPNGAQLLFYGLTSASSCPHAAGTDATPARQGHLNTAA